MLLNQLKSLYKFSVRVRYAPSPTGPMHLGAVRTALFNYMFAKHNDGKFILRIEDTDLDRNVKGSAEQIFDTLKWLQVNPDQSVREGGKFGPYIQSQRLNLYKQIQNQLLLKGFAYPCFCESATHDKKSTKKGFENQQQVGYNGKCRQLTIDEVKQKIKSGQKYVIRIKSDIEQLKVNQFKDEIYGNIAAVPFDDFVLMKKNGYPTYHFANVVDDWKMGITHVIRGVEWLTNTSKHIYLYKILGATPPTFMHLPLIFTADGKKLSKRDPTAPIAHLRQKGYLPESIVNYTGLMGFTPKIAQPTEENQKPKTDSKNQFYALKQLCETFQLSKVNNSPIKSDVKKLNFFNRYYMRKKWKEGDQDFQQQLISTLRKTFNLNSEQQKYKQEFLKQVVDCTLERISNLDDFKQYGYFFSKPDLNKEESIRDIKKIFGANTIIQQKQGKKYFENFNQDLMEKNKKILHNLRLIFVHIIQPQDYNQLKIAETISQFLYDNKQLQNEDVYHILRLAVTGKKSGVNIIKTCHVLGRERVQQDLEYLSSLCREPKQN